MLCFPLNGRGAHCDSSLAVVLQLVLQKTVWGPGFLAAVTTGRAGVAGQSWAKATTLQVLDLGKGMEGSNHRWGLKPPSHGAPAEAAGEVRTWCQMLM